MTPDDTTQVQGFDDQPAYMRPTQREMLRVFIVGALIGLFVPLLGWLLSWLLISPVFCNSGNVLDLCTNSSIVGYYVASIVLGSLAIVLLAYWQIFRPLLAVVGAIASLWGLQQFLHNTLSSSGFEYYIVSAALYGASHLLFYWAVRLRQFVLSLLLVVVLVVILRWVLIT